MANFSTLAEYVSLYPQHDEGLQLLISILEATSMEQTIKWKLPVYTINNKNVVGLGAFKEHFSLWFFNGHLLRDKQGLLENAQEGKTVAMRHIKFQSVNDIDTQVIATYVQEAIDNQLKGISPPAKKKAKLIHDVIPEELSLALKNSKLTSNFNKLTEGKQREYNEYIATAKRQTTKETRIEKILPLIAAGAGLNDKYR